jgi:hypothetical protein
MLYDGFLAQHGPTSDDKTRLFEKLAGQFGPAFIVFRRGIDLGGSQCRYPVHFREFELCACSDFNTERRLVFIGADAITLN